MAVQKLFNLLAIATLALFAVTFNAAPVTAIAAPHQHLNRAISHHGGIAKRSKRSTAGRCKHRPSSSPAPAPEKTPEPAPSSSKAPAPAKPTKEAEPAATTKAPEEAKPTTKAAEPTKAPAPPPAKPAKPAASGGGKKGNVGIAWDGGDSASLGNLVTDYVRWAYTWSPWSPPNRFGLDFVPMYWGPKQDADFKKNVVPGFADNLMFLNEPDQGSQSSMSPQDAAKLWWSTFDGYKNEGYRLWSPAVTNAQSGEKWMDDFLGACGCADDIDVMAVHFYDTDPQHLISFVQHWHSKYGKPVALTEFACQNFGGGAQANMDQVWGFYKTVMPFLTSQDWMEGVFPFGFLENMGNVNPDNQLMRGGQLTDLGAYIVGGNW